MSAAEFDLWLEVLLGDAPAGEFDSLVSRLWETMPGAPENEECSGPPAYTAPPAYCATTQKDDAPPSAPPLSSMQPAPSAPPLLDAPPDYFDELIRHYSGDEPPDYWSAVGTANGEDAEPNQRPAAAAAQIQWSMQQPSPRTARIPPAEPAMQPTTRPDRADSAADCSAASVEENSSVDSADATSAIDTAIDRAALKQAFRDAKAAAERLRAMDDQAAAADMDVMAVRLEKLMHVQQERSRTAASAAAICAMQHAQVDYLL